VLFIYVIYIRVSSEVTVPVSLQEVAGYIEKQVAYLSGGVFVFYFLETYTCGLIAFLILSNKLH